MRSIKNISSYWWCQLAGWGIVALSFLFFAFSFGQGITREYLIKIVIIMTGGVVSTHLLRWFMRKNNWLLLPVEKIIIRLSAAVLPTSVLYSLLVMAMNPLAGLDKNRRTLDVL